MSYCTKFYFNGNKIFENDKRGFDEAGEGGLGRFQELNSDSMVFRRQDTDSGRYQH